MSNNANNEREFGEPSFSCAPLLLLLLRLFLTSSHSTDVISSLTSALLVSCLQSTVSAGASGMSTSSTPSTSGAVVTPNKLTEGLRNFSVVRIVLYVLALAGASLDLTLLASNDDLHTHQRFYSLLIIQSSLVALRSIFAIAVSVLVFHAVDNFHWKDEALMRLWAKVLLLLFLLSVAQLLSVEFALSPQNAASSIQRRHFYVDFGLALFDVNYLFIVYCFNEDVHNGAILPSFD